MTDLQHAHKLKFNTAARLVAATLALVAVIYTVNFYLVTSRTDYMDKEIAHIYDRLDKLEEKLDKHKEEPKTKGAAK